MMGHTPLGYKIANGVAVIDRKDTAKVLNLYKNYLSGLSLIKSAKKAGINTSHAGAKHIMQNKHYLGDDFYPAIIDKETFDEVENELNRRLEKLERNCKAKEIPKKKVPILFHFGDISEYYDNPIKQAEYLYSLLESEVI